METNWNDSQPIYRQLRDRVIHMILDGALKEGDPFSLTDGKGVLYKAQILRADLSQCTFRILNSLVQPPGKFHRHIAIGPTKNADRIEWFVEKATELGIAEITPIICRHSERKTLKLERIQKLVVSAARQSQHYYFPIVNEECSFEKLLESQKGKGAAGHGRS